MLFSKILAVKKERKKLSKCYKKIVGRKAKVSTSTKCVYKKKGIVIDISLVSKNECGVR